MSELARRIAITIGALLIYRLGCFIPISGLSPQAGLLQPNAAARLSIFSLVIFPYLSAAIIIQLVSVVWGRLSALERSGEAGRRRIARYTLSLTLLFAAFQAFGIASTLQSMRGLVAEPSAWFLISTTATLVGGVFFLVWLSELITRHGIGNGLALILSVGIVAAFPAEVATTIELLRQGAVSGNLVLFNAILSVAVVAMIVLVESARRNVPVQYVARQVGKRVFAPRASVLPIKLNSAGFLIPVTVAPWIFNLPLALATLVFGQTLWLAAAYAHLTYGKPLNIVLISIAVFLLAFIYAARVLDPEHAAATLQKLGGTIPDVAPGDATADHLDRIASLTTVVGAVYLVAVLLIPAALLASGTVLPYNFAGGSVLIVVCTILDLKKQVRELSRINRGGERI
ncbi:preprotein translocase subunit SecY [Bradyrhizobium sp. CCBAU 51753]|uniref:preprotein translocase subunit SecY n=1 Tax=Bradyrhizobium sp. CCBAU 51753 TaxID=1325100 RepID=UPI001889D01C|nr:preprotein translocase subunit SecY [Bradyrhizobium sp. CCBAU 51753]QOZ26567.1 preprotein translocase subunit SecY [Bradyrhizobium sp. CCBAU 51753]